MPRGLAALLADDSTCKLMVSAAAAACALDATPAVQDAGWRLMEPEFSMSD
jgi:hypothetical protein